MPCLQAQPRAPRKGVTQGCGRHYQVGRTLYPTPMWRTFTLLHSVMSTLIDTQLPTKTAWRNSNDRTWITDNVIQLIDQTQYHFKAGHILKHRVLRNQVNRERKRLKAEFCSGRLAHLNQLQSKGLCNNIKDITGQRRQENNIQSVADAVCLGDMEVLAGELSMALQAVAQDMEPIAPTDGFNKEVNSTHVIPDCYIVSVDQVERQLGDVKTNKAVGPDMIFSWLLKDTAVELVGPVSALLNASFREGCVSHRCGKQQMCTPCPKVTRPRKLDKDFRPISLTSQLGKLKEHHMRDWLMGGEYIGEIMDDRQFGSVKGCSTIHALIKLYHHWLEALETPGTVVRILLPDFRKAVDKVDHRILLTKMVTRVSQTLSHDGLHLSCVSANKE